MSITAKPDPLTEAQYADRVHYATGAMLDAADFTDEQTYHRARLARVLTYLHGSGTAAGLEVKIHQIEEDEGPHVKVEPGMAIDRLGRIIEVPRPACMRLQPWLEDQFHDGRLTENAFFEGARAPTIDGVRVPGIVGDLFIRFVACERGKTPAFASGPFDALDAVTASRLRDGYELRLFLRTDSLPIPEQTSPSDANELPEMIFNAWRQITDETDENGLGPLAEHLPDQDRTFVFLARLVLPVKRQGDGLSPRTGQTIHVLNHIRPFVVSTRLLASVAGVVPSEGTSSHPTRPTISGFGKIRPGLIRPKTKQPSKPESPDKKGSRKKPPKS